MGSKRNICFLATALAILFFCPAVLAAPNKIGVLGNAEGTVTVVSGDGQDAAERKLKVGDDIFEGDTVRTDASSNAQILFLDKSALTLTPGSEVKMDSFVYDPGSSQGELSIEEAKGAFRFIGGALSKQNHVEIKTPVSTIGIRGGIEQTHISPAGDDAEAIFLYGHDMTVQDKNGKQMTLTEFGGGAHVMKGGRGPIRMSARSVAQRFRLFSRVNGVPARIRRAAMHRRNENQKRPIVQRMEQRQEMREQNREKGRENLSAPHERESDMQKKRKAAREKWRNRMKKSASPEHKEEPKPQ